MVHSLFSIIFPFVRSFVGCLLAMQPELIEWLGRFFLSCSPLQFHFLVSVAVQCSVDVVFPTSFNSLFSEWFSPLPSGAIFVLNSFDFLERMFSAIEMMHTGESSGRSTIYICIFVSIFSIPISSSVTNTMPSIDQRKTWFHLSNATDPYGDWDGNVRGIILIKIYAVYLSFQFSLFGADRRRRRQWW